MLHAALLEREREWRRTSREADRARRELARANAHSERQQRETRRTLDGELAEAATAQPSPKPSPVRHSPAKPPWPPKRRQHQARAADTSPARGAAPREQQARPQQQQPQRQTRQQPQRQARQPEQQAERQQHQQVRSDAVERLKALEGEIEMLKQQIGAKASATGAAQRMQAAHHGQQQQH